MTLQHEGMTQLGFDFLPRQEAEEQVARPTIRGQMRVEQILRERLGPRVIVALTDNRTTMITVKERRGVLYFRLHAIFADADAEIVRAIASYARGRASKRQASMIDEYIEAHRHLVRRPANEELVLLPQGEVHDLQRIFDALNAEFFSNEISARITWTRALRDQRRNSIRMGSYCDEQLLIRIHPALDQAFVPGYFVASVVFHEMLHEVHGAEETAGGRRCIHTDAFLRDERAFPDYQRARRWEQKNLNRLLRY